MVVHQGKRKDKRKGLFTVEIKTAAITWGHQGRGGVKRDFRVCQETGGQLPHKHKNVTNKSLFQCVIRLKELSWQIHSGVKDGVRV